MFRTRRIVFDPTVARGRPSDHFAGTAVCHETIRLKLGDQAFDTAASPLWLNFIKRAYLSRDCFNRSSFFEAFPNDCRSLIQLVIAPGAEVYQNAVAAIELSVDYLIFCL